MSARHRFPGGSHDETVTTVTALSWERDPRSLYPRRRTRARLRRVAAGARYVDPEIAADALSDERSPLTDRELDVLRAGRRGETTGQIARALSLAPGTVRNHISVILGKLSVGTRQQAVLIAEERGWI